MIKLKERGGKVYPEGVYNVDMSYINITILS